MAEGEMSKLGLFPNSLQFQMGRDPHTAHNQDWGMPRGRRGPGRGSKDVCPWAVHSAR
jgi:hypothetical protein